MEHISIQQIKQDFNLQSNDLDFIRFSLNESRIELHPDKNSGTFKNKEEEEKYHKVNEAIEYIDSVKSNNSLMVVEQMTELVKAITKIIPNNREISLQTNVDTKINIAIVNYKSRYFIPKISLTIATAVVTFLFAFPNQIKDNPALAKYINPQGSFFAISWLILLLYTGLFWLLAYMNDERAKRNLSLLKVDSIQNELFEQFIALNENPSFSKDELTEYIFENYSKKNKSISLFGSEIITKEVAQGISELILARAEKKGILLLSNENSLSDKFRLVKGYKP